MFKLILRRTLRPTFCSNLAKSGSAGLASTEAQINSLN